MVKSQKGKEEVEESKGSQQLVDTPTDIQVGCNSLDITYLTYDQNAKQ
jgi:hypothetical protein